MKWERALFRYLKVRGDLRAVKRGPQAVAKRLVRRQAYRTVGRWLRKL